VADQVADLTQTCICVSCACRRPVESWSKASCEPVYDPVRTTSTCRDSSSLSLCECDLLSIPKKSPAGRRPARTCRKPGRKAGLRPALRPG